MKLFVCYILETVCPNSFSTVDIKNHLTISNRSATKILIQCILPSPIVSLGSFAWVVVGPQMLPEGSPNGANGGNKPRMISESWGFPL